MDASPLTEADLAAHRIIVDGLGKLAPVVSEESTPPPYEERRQWRRYWLVDPLDGTKEFVSRNGEFTVNIALIEDGRPRLGVVCAPVLRQVFIGDVALGLAAPWSLAAAMATNACSAMWRPWPLGSRRCGSALWAAP